MGLLILILSPLALVAVVFAICAVGTGGGAFHGSTAYSPPPPPPHWLPMPPDSLRGPSIPPRARIPPPPPATAKE